MISPSPHFEDIYFKVREKEGRIYSDKELIQLPYISHHHIYFEEWNLRKKSLRQLMEYLANLNKGLKILEIGCGNGWLSHRLSENPGFQVVGIDPHSEEIDQANRVFKNSNLCFLKGSIENTQLKGELFDIILFAASIQYFPNLETIISKSFDHINPGGEIIIIDSPFYSKDEIQNAKNRTLDYYTRLGYPNMSEFYFHHSLNELHQFQPSIWYYPNSFLSRISRKVRFMGISIKKPIAKTE